MVIHAFNSSTHGAEAGKDLFEFKVSLVYSSSSRAIQKNTVLKPPTLLPTPPPEKKKNVVTCWTRWYMPKIRISGKIQRQAHPGYIVSSNQVWARLSQKFKNIPVASQCHKIKFTLHDGIFDSRSVLAQFPYAKKDFTFF